MTHLSQPSPRCDETGTDGGDAAARPADCIRTRRGAFWNLPACERSALARVSKQSAISGKPSMSAALADYR
jgi:hypothetical protein